MDPRLTAHHIDYDKKNCDQQNLITLCSACNSKANFNRPYWQDFYASRPAKRGGSWDVEEF
jgi:5-methylcytosine-specific restriction endonuclease McrA